MTTQKTLTSALGAAMLTLSALIFAQAPAAPPALPSATPPAPAAATQGRQDCMGPRGFALPGPAAFESVEVLPDRRITFRLCAPDAREVLVTSSDFGDVIPMGFGGGPAGLELTRGEQGVWSGTTTRAAAPDTYRFNFRVDGVPVTDPQGETYSKTRVGQFTTLEVLGPEGAFQSFDKSIPHGVVTDVEYWSKSLGILRRARIYTPPGYTSGTARYPVLYLVHGAGDSEASWTTVGHAHYVLDNLIAAGKAKPMIVVMPNGHTPDRPAADAAANMLTNGDFGSDFLQDLIPYVDAQYRTVKSPASRAMAGLSMGGAHTLNNGLPHPDLFRYVGIFSMGLMNPQMAAQFEQRHAAALEKSAQDMKLVYFAMGRDDFLYASVAPTRAMFDKYGVRHVYNESGGGHTWVNWRRYLSDFAPRLFR